MPLTKSRQQARDEESRRMDLLLMEISRQLQTALDAEALAAMMDLLQAGVSTEKVVAIITELQRVSNEK